MNTKLVFVFTGILENLTRAVAEKMVKEKGHVVSDTVNAKTGYLVAGVRPGEKLQKAERLGTVMILDEQNFLTVIKQLPAYSDKPVLLVAKPGILYMIGEIGYEYNDEVYNKGEGVTPTSLYRDPNKARSEMIKLERKQWSIWDHPLTTMYYNAQEAIKNERLFSSVLARYGVAPNDIDELSYGDPLESDIYNAITRMTEVDFGLFYDAINIHFYEIHEVEFKQ